MCRYFFDIFVDCNVERLRGDHGQQTQLMLNGFRYWAPVDDLVGLEDSIAPTRGSGHGILLCSMMAVQHGVLAHNKRFGTQQ